MNPSAQEAAYFAALGCLITVTPGSRCGGWHRMGGAAMTTEHLTGPLAGYTITSNPDDPTVQVVALHAAGRLGYLKASYEWVDLDEPLPDDLQHAADELVAAGLLPEFEAVTRG